MSLFKRATLSDFMYLISDDGISLMLYLNILQRPSSKYDPSPAENICSYLEYLFTLDKTVPTFVI